MKKNLLAQPSRVTNQAIELINASYSGQTRYRYARELKNLYEWLNGRELTDESLSDYVAWLHNKGLSPTTCSMVFAAVNAAKKFMESPPGFAVADRATRSTPKGAA